jgi:hypothetical protein
MFTNGRINVNTRQPDHPITWHLKKANIRNINDNNKLASDKYRGTLSS